MNDVILFNGINIKNIRKHFPNINYDFTGKKRIFLDNGAGTLVLKEAANSEYTSRINYSANVDAYYNESKMNMKIIMDGRKAVTDFLNAPNPENIFQGESASELFFRIAFSLRKFLNKDDNVVSTYGEHYSNVAPYIFMKNDGKISEVRLAKINKIEGILDFNDFISLIDKKTKVITVIAENNLLGTKNNLKEISKISRENGSIFIVDEVHYAPQALIDVQKINCDALVFSSYKLFGPRGSFMYINDNIIEKINPFFVDPQANFRTGSYFEPGTRDQAIFAAILEVINYISRISLGDEKKSANLKERRKNIETTMKWTEGYLSEISKLVLEGNEKVVGLNYIKNIDLYGISDINKLKERGSTFSFKFKNINDVKAEKYFWNKFRITVVGGNHWNLTHNLYDINSMLRVTFLNYNTFKEAEDFLKAVEYISKL